MNATIRMITVDPLFVPDIQGSGLTASYMPAVLYHKTHARVISRARRMNELSVISGVSLNMGKNQEPLLKHTGLLKQEGPR